MWQVKRYKKIQNKTQFKNRMNERAKIKLKFFENGIYINAFFLCYFFFGIDDEIPSTTLSTTHYDYPSHHTKETIIPYYFSRCVMSK